MLRIEHLTKIYGEKKAVDDLLLSLPIPVRTIITARLTNVWLMGTLYVSVVLLPVNHCLLDHDRDHGPKSDLREHPVPGRDADRSAPVLSAWLGSSEDQSAAEKQKFYYRTRIPDVFRRVLLLLLQSK